MRKIKEPSELYDYVLATTREEVRLVWVEMMADSEKFAQIEAMAEDWEEDGFWLFRMVSKMYNTYRNKE